MMENCSQHIIEELKEFIGNKAYPCIGAKVSLAKESMNSLVAGHMACPASDNGIAEFLYSFVTDFRNNKKPFSSAAIIFTGPQEITEQAFEWLLWQRLQALINVDAEQFPYDPRVSKDTASAEFSFSIGGEAFFIIGMHPSSSRASRRFTYPALIFNPHQQFNELKEQNKYERMKLAIRKKDIAFSGTVNPMLNDHGRSSEAEQYSGMFYKEAFECPLKIKHGNT